MKHRTSILSFTLFVCCVLLVIACSKNAEHPPATTPYKFPKIQGFRDVPVDADNPETYEGIALGKKLFFDSILSKNNKLSCADCHMQKNAFSDNVPFSKGVDGTNGTRNAMSLVNLAYYKKYFWDGRSSTLREQALIPVPQPNEMHLPWSEAEAKLQASPAYVELFWKAFGTKTITKELVAKALEQFEKTLLSYNSPLDKYNRGDAPLPFDAMEGMKVFLDPDKGDCFHCHQTPELFIANDPNKIFSNNGMDTVFTDLGLGAITGKASDNGRFKIPTLRNLAFTAPYMHDGRFATLDEVIDMYDRGPQMSATIDTIMIVEANKRFAKFNRRNLALSPQDKAYLKAFLLSLSDSSYLHN